MSQDMMDFCPRCQALVLTRPSITRQPEVKLLGRLLSREETVRTRTCASRRADGEVCGAVLSVEREPPPLGTMFWVALPLALLFMFAPGPIFPCGEGERPWVTEPGDNGRIVCLDNTFGAFLSRILECEVGTEGPYAVGDQGERGAAQIHPIHQEAMIRMNLDFGLERDRLLFAQELYREQGPKPWSCSRYPKMKEKP